MADEKPSATRNLYQDLPPNAYNNILERVLLFITQGESAFLSVLPGCGMNILVQFLIKNLSEQYNEKLFVVTGTPVDLHRFILKEEQNLSKDKVIIWRASDTWNSSQTSRLINDKIKLIQNLKRFSIIGIGPFVWYLNPDWIIGNFGTMFVRNLYIGPFEGNAYELHIKYTAKHQQVSLTNKMIQDIFKLSGGIPRIFKYILILHRQKPIVNFQSISLEDFLDYPSLYFEFKFLSQLLDKYNKKILVKLGIIDSNGNIKSELLKTYYTSYYKQLKTETNVIYTHNTLLKSRENLTQVENTILDILMDKDNFVSLQDLVYKLGIAGYKYQPDSLYKLVQRLREKLKDTHIRIINNRGKGYRLTFTK